MSLRFLMMTTFYPPEYTGGDAIYVQRLTELLTRAGHEVVVVCSSDAFRIRRDSPKHDRQEVQGATVVRLRTRSPWLSSILVHQLGSPVFYRGEVQRVLDRFRPDVIHYHNISLIGGPGIIRMGTAVKFLTLHDHWSVCPTHALFKFNREVCRSKNCISCTLQARRLPQVWRYSKLLADSYQGLDLILAPSRFTADRHAEEGIETPIRVLPHFLPARFFNPGPAPDGQDAYVLYVGRLEHPKGIGWLTSAFQQDGVKLVVVGDGSLTPEMEALHKSRKIELRRWVGETELTGLYRGAVATVVPSLCHETFGLSLAESMACGTPVIVRDQGTLRETVRQSGGGLLFQSPEQLNLAVSRVAKTPELRASLGAKARSYALEKWTESSHLERYIQLVTHSLGNRR